MGWGVYGGMMGNNILIEFIWVAVQQIQIQIQDSDSAEEHLFKLGQTYHILVECLSIQARHSRSEAWWW